MASIHGAGCARSPSRIAATLAASRSLASAVASSNILLGTFHDTSTARGSQSEHTAGTLDLWRWGIFGLWVRWFLGPLS